MNSEQNNRKPFFPSTRYVNADGETIENNNSEFTIRDWFAGQALIGILAEPETTERDKNALSHADIAVDAYAFANAMMVERAKGGNK